MQFMITQEMRASLHELGYRDEDIDDLVPERAAAIIDNRIPCPSQGVPSSWKRGYTPSRKGAGFLGSAFGGLKKVVSFGVVTALALHFSGMDLGEVSVFIDQAVAFLIDSTRAH